ncbi:sigma-54 dependent transcriptional regulator [Pseudoalteromonas marina]|uniref:sigma-54-dependent transcriptional regulator n=1 Tax=Pseudoalteromonas TaxID=53246 RepID=UPI00023183D6|nr:MULTISPECIES: sigma-54 dependent transcriptional regulator [Pseudoalteromonas]ATG58514.1 sigma-54-dependent Fis family transcriptional regulator [Pseudoalteromonas marina]MDA8939364.1 sigma-54 dependent transcriptional regulator [Pseudoalteromonas marina]GAA76766.1 two-component system, NtrC family, nitrogen regulation response regulator GlnG [Pseudoalteromonas sp. BSi20480]|tara:strand:- start:1888 stop:3219 length:1332 start_codon:yes stop_codon:yes gene_type:complete
MEKILIVDDNPAVLEALSLLLEIHNFNVVTATTPFEAIQIVQYQRISLVIQDMNFTSDTTSGEEGKTLFYALREENPHLPIILITAWTELSTAIELVKAGAADYLPKPWDDHKLLTCITNLIELGRTKQLVATHNRQQKEREDKYNTANLAGLIFKSTAMERLVTMALQVAKSDISALITGPNGSGKECIATIIQKNSSLINQPFIKVNAGALPQELLEAELFGAEAGAYTGISKQRIGRFEAADGGTLFLDEIGNLPLSGQMKLLRVLQTGEFERLGSTQTRKVTVRVISATNENLLQAITEGRFREDLYYRLNVIELNVPALCERVDDIAPLINHFLPHRELSIDAEQALNRYQWPGNVRELENACKRVGVIKPNGLLSAEDFDLTPSSPIKNNDVKKEPTKFEIEQSIRANQGVIAKVAREFGLSRQALYRRLQKMGIDY